MAEVESEAAATSDDAEPAGEVGKAKARRTGEKARKSHGEKALASLRAAKRGQREVSDPAERAQFLLAEANVLALLDVAEALGGGSDGADE